MWCNGLRIGASAVKRDLNDWPAAGHFLLFAALVFDAPWLTRHDMPVMQEMTPVGNVTGRVAAPRS